MYRETSWRWSPCRKKRKNSIFSFKVHFMRNILVAYSSQGQRSICLGPIHCMEDGLEDSLAFYAFPQLDARKISSTNVLDWLNREIRCRTGMLGIFPSVDSYNRLATTYLIEYMEDWSGSRAYLCEQSVQSML